MSKKNIRRGSRLGFPHDCLMRFTFEELSNTVSITNWRKSQKEFTPRLTEKGERCDQYRCDYAENKQTNPCFVVQRLMIKVPIIRITRIFDEEPPRFNIILDNQVINNFCSTVFHRERSDTKINFSIRYQTLKQNSQNL